MGFEQWIGPVLSYLYVFSMIGVAQLLLRRGLVGASVTRKIVHIGVSHWWIIALAFIDQPTVALLIPVSFIAVNYFSYRKHLFAAMEHQNHRKNLGTVYFPIALAILVMLTWSGPFPRWYGLLAILALGWGDGLAGLVGERWGARPGAMQFTVADETKSLAGSAALFLSVAAISAMLLWLFSGPLAHANELQLGHRFDLWSVIRARTEAFVGRGGSAPAGDSIVLQAFSRIDAIARIVPARVAHVGPAQISAAVPWSLTPAALIAVAVTVAAIAAIVELTTPWGLDNLTLPLAVFFTLVVLLTLPQAWLVRIAWALGSNIVVALVAYRRRSVNVSGSIAGAIVGSVIFLSGGFALWSMLMLFFFSSTLLGRFHGKRKQQAESIHAKGGRRDAVQVFANSGLAALMALAAALTGHPMFLLGFAILIAAATADTWASEIGVHSRRDPVSILTMRTIPRGTSGGVSPLGLVASAAGALFIGLSFALAYLFALGWNGIELLAIVLAVTCGGFIGSIADSILGAAIQAQYFDNLQQVRTEKRHDAAGAANRLVRGFHFVTNDAVNAASGLLAAGALLALVR